MIIKQMSQYIHKRTQIVTCILLCLHFMAGYDGTPLFILDDVLPRALVIVRGIAIVVVQSHPRVGEGGTHNLHLTIIMCVPL